MSLISDVYDELKGLNQSTKSLRQFSILMWFIASGFLIYGIFNQIETMVYITAILALLFLVGFIFPKSVKKIHFYWMAFAFIMGWFVSRFLLSLIYFFVVTPIGLIRRIFGKHFLDLSYKSVRKSYWVKRDNPKVDYSKMS